MKTKILVGILISFLLTNCDNKETSEDGVELNCDIASRVFEGDLIFTTQTQIDAFNNLGYASIMGRVEINGTNSGNDPVTTLNGALNCISFIEGGVKISNNNLLQNLEGFLTNVTSIAHLNIDNNDSLASLGGLDHLTSITYYIAIHNNDLLTNLQGTPNNITSTISLFISENDNLISLEGLNNLNSIENLNIENNPNLLDLKGLDALAHIDREINISHNESLENIDALSSNINSTLEVVFIYDNFSLLSIKGLSNISTLNSLHIKKNNKLLNLEGLEDLNFANEFNRDGIYIEDNNSLENVDALSNLIFVISLYLTNNPNLSNYCGIEQLIISNSYVDVYINGNSYDPSVTDILNGFCSQ